MTTTDVRGADPLRTVTPERATAKWCSDETLFTVCESLWNDLWVERYVDDDGAIRWKGAISNWFREHKKTNLYSPVMHLMKAMGSCYIESRGSRWTDSVVRLVKPPTLEGLKAVRTEHFFFEKPNISKPDKIKVLVQAVDDLRNQVQELTARISELERNLK